MKTQVEEREVKYELAEDAPELDAHALFAGLGRWTEERVVQRATYFDTADLRLTRAGASVRHRSDDGWTVKTPVGTDGDGVVRQEHRFAGGAGRPPVEAIDLVLAWSRVAALEEVATVVTRRRRLCLTDGIGAGVLEITDDAVSTQGTAEPITFREVEVELGACGDRRALRTVGRRLERMGATRSPWPSKIAHALGDIASRPADAPPAGPVPSNADVTLLAQHAITESLHRLVSHDHVARVGDDPEGVHHARVATRRLRSDLRTFRAVLDTAWADDIRCELRWLGGEFGRVRDADVLLTELTRHAAELRGPDRVGSAPLLTRLDEQRTRHHDALLEALRSPRYLALLDRLVAAARRPPVVDTDDGDRKRRALSLARRPWRRLRRTVPARSENPTDEQLHEVRKRAKHTRYALEAISPVASRRSERLAKRLGALQDLLGAHHDAVVATTWLRATAADIDDPKVAFTAGLLAGALVGDATSRRDRWQHAWRRVRSAARDAF